MAAEGAVRILAEAVVATYGVIGALIDIWESNKREGHQNLHHKQTPMNTTIMKTSVSDRAQTLSDTSYLHSTVYHQYFLKQLRSGKLHVNDLWVCYWSDTPVIGILATSKDGGVDIVQPSTLHSLRHFTGG